MRPINIYPFLLCLLLMGGRLSLLAQDRFLSGAVTDAATGQPVPFANVRLLGNGKGVVASDQGRFVLPAPEQPDTLHISCIGYQTLLQAIAPGSPALAAFQLTPAVLGLPEVTVTARNGMALLQAAILRIPHNYDTSGVLLSALYLETLRLAADTLHYTEAELEIYKTYYTDKARKDQVRVITGRKQAAMHVTDQQLYHWMGHLANGVRGVLGDDFIKQGGFWHSPFNPDNLSYYECSYMGDIRSDGRLLHVLQMAPKAGSRKALLRLKIFLDAASLAIAKYDFELSPAGVTWVNRHGKGGFRYFLASKLMKTTMDFTQIKSSVIYRYNGRKWYLHTMQRHFDTVVNSRKRNIKDLPWLVDISLQVTNIDKQRANRFTNGDIMNSDAPVDKYIN